MKKSILVVSNNKLFIEGIIVGLETHGCSCKLISNLNASYKNHCDIKCLSDVFLLDEVLKDSDAVIYENIDSKQSDINDLTSITNMVNAFVNLPNKRLIYFGNQKGYNTSPFEITMDENAVNNFTKEILPAVRHSLLMELEVLRGINEDCNGIIFSAPSLLSGSETSDSEVFKSTFNEKNAINYFTHLETLLKLVIEAIHSTVTGKYLIQDTELSFEQLELKLGPQHKTFWENIKDTILPEPKMNRLILNNDYSRELLKF